MNIAQGLLIALLALPILEIYLLIKVAGTLGFLPTLLLLLAAASTGGYLLRTQSWAAWQKVQACLARGELPAAELMDGMLIMAGAVLLLVPGFLSDLMALICLIPSTRKTIAAYLVKHRYGMDPKQSGGQTTNVIEGEYRRED